MRPTNLNLRSASPTPETRSRWVQPPQGRSTASWIQPGLSPNSEQVRLYGLEMPALVANHHHDPAGAYGAFPGIPPPPLNHASVDGDELDTLFGMPAPPQGHALSNEGELDGFLDSSASLQNNALQDGSEPGALFGEPALLPITISEPMAPPDPGPQEGYPAEFHQQVCIAPELLQALDWLGSSYEQLNELAAIRRASVVPAPSLLAACPQVAQYAVGAFTYACYQARNATEPAYAMDVLRSYLEPLETLGPVVDFPWLGDVCRLQFIGLMDSLQPSIPHVPVVPADHLVWATPTFLAQGHDAGLNAAPMDGLVIAASRTTVTASEPQEMMSSLYEALSWRHEVRKRKSDPGATAEEYKKKAIERSLLIEKLLRNEAPSLEDVARCLTGASNAGTLQQIDEVREFSRLLLRTFFRVSPSAFVAVLAMVMKSYQAALRATLKALNSTPGEKMSTLPIAAIAKQYIESVRLFPAPLDPADQEMLGYVAFFVVKFPSHVHLARIVFGDLPYSAARDPNDLIKASQQPIANPSMTFTNANPNLMHSGVPQATPSRLGGVKRLRGEAPRVASEKGQTGEKPASKLRAVGNSNRPAALPVRGIEAPTQEAHPENPSGHRVRRRTLPPR